MANSFLRRRKCGKLNFPGLGSDSSLQRPATTGVSDARQRQFRNLRHRTLKGHGGNDRSVSVFCILPEHLPLIAQLLCSGRQSVGLASPFNVDCENLKAQSSQPKLAFLRNMPALEMPRSAKLTTSSNFRHEYERCCSSSCNQARRFSGQG